MRCTSIASVALLAAMSFAQQAPPEPNAVFHSSAREVLLEVVVRDSHGKLVTKIDPSQLSVYEDGVRQDIRSFRLVSGREVREADEKQMAATGTTPVATGNRPISNPLRTVNVVCLILADLNPETRKFAFDAAQKFVSKELRPDTFIGVFSLDSTGLRPMFPFSNNRDNLMKAIELAAVNQLPSVNQTTAAMLNGFSMMAGGITPAIDTGSVKDPLGTRGDMGNAVIAGLRKIDSLTKLVKQLGQLPFQKTVLLMSTGLTRPPDQLERWDAMIKQSNQSGVTFYGLDVYGLGVCQDSPVDCNTSSSPTDASSGFTQIAAQLSQTQSTVGMPPRGPRSPGGSSTQGPSLAQQSMEAAHQTDYLRYGVLSANTQEALRELSERTGGFVIANTNNLDPVLARVMDEVDTHYEVTYHPASPANDGHFRKIEVKLARADLHVETRSGYFAVPGEPLAPGDFGALHALDTKPLPHAFDFGAKAFRFGSRYAISFEVPVANLTATAEATEKKHRYHAYLLALVKNEQGEIVDRFSRDVPSDVADTSLPWLRSENMIYEHPVSLGPGRYTVETAVVDEEGNRSSTQVFAIENREQSGTDISDVVLVRRGHDSERSPDGSDPFEGQGKRLLPFVNTIVSDTALPFVYFVVYPDVKDAGPISLQTQLLKNGRTVANQTSPLSQPDSNGAVPMTIQPALDPGDYEVRIVVAQGKRTVQRSLKYTIAKK